MQIIAQIAILVATCLFGYRSTDGFELLIAGLVLFAITSTIVTQFTLSGQFRLLISRVLKLEQPPDWELIHINKNAMVDRVSFDYLATFLFGLTSIALLCKSIFIMLND